MNGNGLPLVTLSTCTYKRFDTVYRTIDSVLSQDYGNFEYILSDDGSDNFPGEELERYIREKAPGLRLTVIHHERNLGTVRHLNRLAEAAKGEYWIDVAAGDTFLEAGAVAKIVETMRRKGCGVLSFGRKMISPEGEGLRFLPQRMFAKRLSGLDCRKAYGMFVSGQCHAMFSGSSLAFRMDAFRKLGGYDERYRLWEDGPFIAKALYAGEMGMDYTLTAVGYESGGVSTDGKVHPAMEKDVELYNRTDRVAHLDELNAFRRKLLQVNLREDRVSAGMALRHPVIAAYKLGYRTLDRIGLALDKKAL